MDIKKEFITLYDKLDETHRAAFKMFVDYVAMYIQIQEAEA